MKTTPSITELSGAGITLQADEAVAIAQQTIGALRDGQHDADEAQPPYGPPSADNVFLREDGSVWCRGCSATPAVSEVAIFLQALLPAQSMRVPGGLRYTIARALLEVDVQPFDSLDEFSRALARHEHGDRAGVVRGVVARYEGARKVVPLSADDRRRAQASASELRRALREADARLYQQQQAPADVRVDEPAPPRDRTLMATAACLAAGCAEHV